MQENQEEESTSPTTITPKKKALFIWNSEINSGNLLTILVIIIAASALFYQKKLVNTKVDELQEVVRSLEDEKQIRELSILQQEEKNLNSFSYNLNYTVEQLKATGRITSNEFIFILATLNEIIDQSLNKKGLTSNERKKLELTKERNINKIQVFAHCDIYQTKIEEFSQKNKPLKEAFKNDDEYLKSMESYNGALQKNINLLQNLLDSLLEKPINNIKTIEKELLPLQQNNIAGK